MGERRPYKPEVTGSIPVPPTSNSGGGLKKNIRWGERPDYRSGRSSRPNDGIPPTMPNADCGIRSGEFKSEIYNLKFEIRFGGVVQLVRAPACHAGGCGFKPRRSRQMERG